MPLPKYYRPILPIDLNNIIGEFAGFGKLRLVFTETPKRHFLGSIWIAGYYSTRSIKRRLKPNSWRKVYRASPIDRRNLLRKLEKNFFMSNSPCTWIRNNFYDGIENIHKWLSEVIGYSLVW
jgi:hypothetical protein